jgi:hypothetical protein
MVLGKFTCASSAILIGSLRATGAFFGCCDDPPPPAPAAQGQTNTVINVDVAKVVEARQPGEKFILATGTGGIHQGAGVSADADGLEIAARLDMSAGGTFIYVGKLIVKLGKSLGLGQAQFPGGSQETSVPPSTGPGSVAAVPKPRGLYRLWRSPTIQTVVMSAETIQTIEDDGHPLRFAYSFPFQSGADYTNSTVAGFWLEAYDPSGNNVIPAGARLVSTQQIVGEWPISSAMLWPTTQLPVMSISFDVVNDDGSNVTPSQLGCDVHQITFRVGLSSSDSKANWDFGWAACLWRTETDLGHAGDGGMWLGWHAASFDALPTLNDAPQILSLTDLAGTPISSVTRGSSVLLTVRGGFQPVDTEIAVDGYSMPVTGFGPGPNPGESIYRVVVPTQSQLGPWSLSFRNLGATMKSNPSLVQQITAGFDYVPVTVR